MTNMNCDFFYQISEWKLTKLLQNPFQIKNIWIQLEMSLTEIQIHPISLIFGLDKEATSYTDMILPKNVQVFREVQRGRKMVGGLTSGRRDSAFQDNHQFLVSGIRDGRRYFGWVSENFKDMLDQHFLFGMFELPEYQLNASNLNGLIAGHILILSYFAHSNYASKNVIRQILWVLTFS